MLTEDVLTILEKNRGLLISGSALAKEFNVSRTAVWKVINSLRDLGHAIESVPNSGYLLRPDSDGLSHNAIQNQLTTRTLGNPLILLRSVDSTNLYLKNLAQSEIEEGYTVVADEQMQGRGRLGRTFYSPRGNGIYMSVLLRPALALTDTPFLTICAAVAVCRTLKKVCGLNAGIKWVNDLFCDGKKLCGILTEAFISAEMQTVDYAIIGIGINLRNIPDEVSDIATCVYSQTGQRGIRNTLIAEILNALEQVYSSYIQHNAKDRILDEYTKNMIALNRRVEVVSPASVYEAYVIGVNSSGGLLVKRPDGAVCTLTSGEIKLMEEN